MYIEKINSPADIKALSVIELTALASEIRSGLMNRLSKRGGHFGPNFGFVEATIALHYVFDSPKDKIVYDVSHQSYTHKMLTGRKNAFLFDEHFGDVSGYTNPEESQHDFFNVGHTSTAVSLACGLAKGRDLKGDRENVIAVIGDGSLSGGEALEGLDFAAELASNFIIVVNDNDMSIAENHGGLYQNLKALRESNGTCPCNLFKAMGLDYLYVPEGNDIAALIDAFSKVKDCDHPIVVHINTLKGKGYAPAEENKESWHWCMPFDEKTGKSRYNGSGESYDSLTCDYLLKKMKADEKVVAVVAAVPTNIGFTEDKRKEAGKQFIDVGIAEEHAVAMVSGIARNGGKPVFSTHSSFFQRTYDQISQDLCINGNAATLLVNTASVYGMNDVTHLGIFDIPMLSNIPNLVYLAPTNCEEYFAMLDWSIEQDQFPVAVRIPCNGVIHTNEPVDTDYSKLNQYQMTQQGREIAILALGDFYQIGEALAKLIAERTGIEPTLINPRYITGIDTEMLEALKKDHAKVITLEDGILDGGFGEKIARFYGPADMKVYNYGLKKAFIDRYSVEEILRENHLTPEQIVQDVL
ncbi:1-deoxy-D-xylulose-5-phosphate synthase [Ruminococcus sp.]|uniref:1-deoxy-D-xylulose-5-phosphate synthase n=1 Tax=Ruminococcus sp. TaxID=41978 RepID=UPI0026174F07|nr:1-deoxy-D-xylulose-5-phosphate synthase [Ruminococcus sp.]MDD7556738.1 1-deoxy-D-xylulose-5-phosphate synthase [Ruminococcus sp.]MDY4964365.1 1-deoxy-D-xylulose-5-phosphate synthase [Ruminococcus callidus]